MLRTMAGTLMEVRSCVKPSRHNENAYLGPLTRIGVALVEKFTSVQLMHAVGAARTDPANPRDRDPKRLVSVVFRNLKVAACRRSATSTCHFELPGRLYAPRDPPSAKEAHLVWPVPHVSNSSSSLAASNLRILRESRDTAVSICSESEWGEWSRRAAVSPRSSPRAADCRASPFEPTICSIWTQSRRPCSATACDKPIRGVRRRLSASRTCRKSSRVQRPVARAQQTKRILRPNPWRVENLASSARRRRRAPSRHRERRLRSAADRRPTLAGRSRAPLRRDGSRIHRRTPPS